MLPFVLTAHWQRLVVYPVIAENPFLFIRVPEVVQELPVTSPVDDFRQPHYSSDGNFETPSKRAPTKRRAGKSKRPEQDHYETDYTTGGESCDELEEDWIRYASPLFLGPPAHLIYGGDMFGCNRVLHGPHAWLINFTRALTFASNYSRKAFE